MEEVIQPTVMQNGVVQQVPFIYGSPERWKQIQKDGYYRDKKGKIMLPLITFKRNNIEKVRNVANKLDANSPHLVYNFQKKYSVKNAYDNFALLNNLKPLKTNYAVQVEQRGERSVKATFSLKLYGYLVPDVVQKQLSKLTKKFNTPAQIIFNMETVQSIEKLNEQNRIDNSRLSIQSNNDFTEFDDSAI
jgi:plasmid maintenance system antidote protein VapI